MGVIGFYLRQDLIFTEGMTFSFLLHDNHADDSGERHIDKARDNHTF